MYFRAIFYGVFLTVCSAFFHIFFFSLENSAYADVVLSTLDVFQIKNSPDAILDKPKLAVVLSLPIVLGPLLGGLLNIPQTLGHIRVFHWWNSILLKRAISDNDLELLILRCMENWRPIMFTLSDRKVYVGWVVRGVDPTESRKAVRILPLASGYRNQETQQFEFTTFYSTLIQAIDGLEESEVSHLELEDLETVFPVEQISSCHPFDFEAYVQFSRPHSQNQDPARKEARHTDSTVREEETRQPEPDTESDVEPEIASPNDN